VCQKFPADVYLHLNQRTCLEKGNRECVHGQEKHFMLRLLEYPVDTNDKEVYATAELT